MMNALIPTKYNCYAKGTEKKKPQKSWLMNPEKSRTLFACGYNITPSKIFIDDARPVSICNIDSYKQWFTGFPFH